MARASVWQMAVKRLPWQSWVRPWRNTDLLLLVLPIVLTILGGLLIRSTQMHLGWTDWWQHWVVGGVGLVITLAIARFRYEYLLRFHWVIYALVIASLITVMFIGTSALGAQSWITIGGFNIQPSEFAKVGAILTLAALLHDQPASTLSGILRPVAIVAVPWALVFIQPDLGSSLVFGAITLGMLYWANANLGWILLMLSPLVSAIVFNLPLPYHLSLILWAVWVVGMAFTGWRTIPQPLLGALGGGVLNLVAAGMGRVLWSILKDHQKDRLIMFLDPDKDPLGGGYHLIQSRIAIGAGGLWGRGLNHGTQTQLNFIPEQHTDFIFSAVGEELGFVGSLLVLLGFWLICLRLLIVAQTARDNFGSLITIGVLAMIMFQLFINVGMTVGLSPVTGIPLPWLSYGRSAMLTNAIAIGLVQSVANYRQRLRY